MGCFKSDSSRVGTSGDHSPSGKKVQNISLKDFKLQLPNGNMGADATKSYPPYYSISGNTLKFMDKQSGSTSSNASQSRTELRGITYHKSKTLSMKVKIKEISGKETIAQVWRDGDSKPCGMLHVHSDGRIESQIRKGSSTVHKQLGRYSKDSWFDVKASVKSRSLTFNAGGGSHTREIDNSSRYFFKFGLYGNSGKSEVKPRWGS